MENETENGAAPVVAATTTPEITRLSVPASAIFSEEELTLPAAPVEGATLEKPDVTPAAPVVPDPAKPAAAAPEPAKPETKIKIGGKEYTQAELEAKLAERAAPAAAPAKPAAAPAPEPVKQPTPEEISVAETKWVETFLAKEKPNLGVTDEQLETIITGGKEGAEALSKVLSTVFGKAVLETRKQIYADMNPVLGRIQQQLQPVVSNAQEVEYAAAEHQFTAAFPEFKEHMGVVRNIGAALLEKYPKEMAAMTREEQLREVAAQADAVLAADFKRWNPTATTGWREAAKAPAAAAPVAAAPVVPAPAPAAPAPAAAAPRVQPPNANTPAASPSGGVPASFHKQTAKDLQS